MYHISVQQEKFAGRMTVTVDDVIQEDTVVTLIDDWGEHKVEVLIFTDLVKQYI